MCTEPAWFGGIGKNGISPGRPTKISPPSKTMAAANPADRGAGSEALKVWAVAAPVSVMLRPTTATVSMAPTRLKLDIGALHQGEIEGKLKGNTNRL
jgi:hypothetical protein